MRLSPLALVPPAEASCSSGPDLILFTRPGPGPYSTSSFSVSAVLTLPFGLKIGTTGSVAGVFERLVVSPEVEDSTRRDLPTH